MPSFCGCHLPNLVAWPPARCVQEGKPIKDCAKQAPECDGLRNAYSACKRGQLDARSRLRGNKGY